MAQLGGRPVLILKEGTERRRGRDAQSNNIMAAKAVASAVRTTLGPKGMDKMLVDPAGLVVITNDGATILDEMDIKHPAAKMIVEVAKTQDEEAGDGTTTAAVLAGELLKKAEELIEQRVHPVTIVAGYRLAADKAREILETIALASREELLPKIAETAMTGKGIEFSKEKLSNLVVAAVKSVVKEVNGRKKVDVKDVAVEKRYEGSVDDSELVEGIIIDRARTHMSMPTKIENARIALLATPIEVRKTDTKSEISITAPGQRRSFLEREEKMVRDVAYKVINSGANVVFCQKGIDDLARHYLAKAGVFACHRIKKRDLEKLSKATGGKIVTNLDELAREDLGEAGLVEETKVGGHEMIFVKKCKNPGIVSIILRGGTEQVVSSLDRALHDALRVVGVTIEDETLVAGGGSPEVEVALRLREYAATLKGREQLAVSKFAEALEIIPLTLAENAGLNQIEMLAELRSQHERGKKNVGVEVYSGKPMDMLELGVVEPLRVKTQAIESACEAASMILRIDDVIAASRQEGGKEKPIKAPEYGFE